jgi:diguanylate cyclase (GGDEF)-like protein
MYLVMAAPETEDDRRRLEAIGRLGVLDRAGDPGLTALARVGSYVTGAASVGVHILDDHLQYRVAGENAPLGNHPREDSLCRLVVEGEQRIICRDATQEPLLAYSSFVRPPAPLRFYASVPLRTAAGDVIGTLCAWDEQPREISEEQVARFEDLAEQVVSQIELKRIAADLGHAASHDPLTGAVNRLVLSDRLAQAFARQLRSQGDVLVAVADVDGFKGVNDTHGHDVGDLVLQEVVRRLLGATRVQDTVARLGGDEFAVVAEALPGTVTATDLARRLELALDWPYEVDGHALDVGVTVGVAVTEAGDDVRSALARADRAMYARKRERAAAGRSGTR